MDNTGFDKNTLLNFQKKMEQAGQNFLVVADAETNDEYVNVYFIGEYEGKNVIYDAACYTLRLHYTSELYEIAEHEAAKRFPEFNAIKYEEDENGDMRSLNDKEEEIGLFMAELIMEMEEEGELKVKEYVEIDPHIDFGVGIDACLHVEKMTEEVITGFVNDFNAGTLHLDDTLYTFQTEPDTGE